MTDPTARLERIERRQDELAGLLRQVLEELRAKRRTGAKRAQTVARRARTEVVHQVSDTDRAAARRVRRRMGL